MDNVSESSVFPKSFLAVVSFIVSLVCAAAWIVCITLMIITQSELGSNHDYAMMATTLAFWIFASNVTGIIFGIIASTKKISNKRKAKQGIIINSIPIVLIILIFIGANLSK